ncbi:pimeloyl-ACP methyl ester carboxylesterase [Arthrobacter silviterrae]|uniref:Alpha/beta hydrolase n=1 Tax=Arthrobacter silviterrae TaxID=2026658 RepID=A0ABX0D7B8_9MICC|nr:alpha/beta hydrolase [Arthrobacter silviterrae]MDQ0276288.1 pimeloyl-ACP methyl ester carboxylesterase [Arthrobacter silviterrae]NGN82531.1 alpha/beta hydrolase [Arthrobacter silviterrae]
MAFLKPRTAPAGTPVTVDLSARATENTVDVDGTQVHYWDYAPLVWTAATRTIVMVHGFRGDHHGLERVVELLPDHRVIMPDLPGFGSSPAFAHGEHSVVGYGAFLAGFLDSLALGTGTVLLGHSFGSIVAAHFAASHPHRVFPLVLVNPIASPALEGPKGIMTKLAVFYYWAAARLPRPLGNGLLRSWLIVHVMSVTMAKTRDPKLLAFIHGQHHAYFSDFADRDMLLESFRASVGGTVREVAAQLTLPVLLIAGAEDEIATLPTQHKLVGLLPDAELVVIDDVGHLIHYETPGPAARAIDSFLERHPAP